MVIELIVGALTLLLVVVRLQQRFTIMHTLSHEKHRAWVLPGLKPATLYVQAFLLGVVVIALTYALTRPQGQNMVEKQQAGRQLMVLLDISRSMLVEDCKPSRLVCAQQKIKALVKQLKADQVGLMVFAGDAVVLCPFTSDYTTFFMFLDDVGPETMSASSTSVMGALRILKERYDALEFPATRLALVVTDGEDFAENDTTLFDELKAADIRIATLAIGTYEGGPIPDYPNNGQFVRDVQGEIVISRREDKRLKELTAQCLGRFVVADPVSDKDLETVLGWIESTERTGNATVKMKSDDEYYVYPTAVALLLALIEWCLL